MEGRDGCGGPSEDVGAGCCETDHFVDGVGIVLGLSEVDWRGAATIVEVREVLCDES